MQDNGINFAFPLREYNFNMQDLLAQKFNVLKYKSFSLFEKENPKYSKNK